jgi:hypothetical protein
MNKQTKKTQQIVWNLENVNKNEKDKKYFYVTDSSTTKRLITGARRSWESKDLVQQTTVFIPKLKLAGPEVFVVKAMEKEGLSKDEIKKYLNTSINSKNFKDSEEFKREFELQGENKKNRKTQTKKFYYSPRTINRNHTIMKNCTSTEALPKEKKSKPVIKRGETISEKLEVIRKNKLSSKKDSVVDVSFMDLETGKSTKVINRPKTSNSGKFFGGELEIVSNNVESYIYALRFLENDPDVNVEKKYEKEIKEFTEKYESFSDKKQVSPPKKQKKKSEKTDKKKKEKVKPVEELNTTVCVLEPKVHEVHEVHEVPEQKESMFKKQKKDFSKKKSSLINLDN